MFVGKIQSVIDKFKTTIRKFEPATRYWIETAINFFK